MIWLLKGLVSGEQTKKITRKFNYASCLEYHPHWAKPFNTVFAKAELLVFKHYRNEFERVCHTTTEGSSYSLGCNLSIFD